MHEKDTKGNRTKARILAAGLDLLRANKPITAHGIARALDLTHPAVLHHFGNTTALGEAVAVEAVRLGDRAIVPMLITARHSAVAGLTDQQRREFLDDCFTG